MENFDWVLSNKFAVGPAPLSNDQISFLVERKINCILNLCSEEEVPFSNFMNSNFICNRVKLNDHRSSEFSSLDDIRKAINNLNDLLNKGSVYVHCFAGIERSPLVCMGWLIKFYKLDVMRAYEYLKEIHPITNPMNSQLMLLNNL
tara:strand:- start:721 stop:1158 length:438 start_codon:yes stop_codon:yes gene_type:complete